MSNRNLCKIRGVVVSEPVVNHRVAGKNMYLIYIDVIKKKSKDTIPIIVPEDIVKKSDIQRLRPIYVEGKFTSYIIKNKVVAYVTARKTEKSYDKGDMNNIEILGKICSKISYNPEINVIRFTIKYNTSILPCVIYDGNDTIYNKLNSCNEVKVNGHLALLKNRKTGEFMLNAIVRNYNVINTKRRQL